jgi:hypothetical protein
MENQTMKIAITKIGANITFSPNNGSAANADILYALRTMKGHRHEFTVCTKKTSNTVLPKSIGLSDIRNCKSFNDFDLVLVFNGSINFFGGVCDDALLALYRALNNTKVPIVFVQTDGALYLQELWPLIQKREWAKGLSASEFFVDPKNVYYLTQGRDYSKTLEFLKSAKNAIVPTSIHHFPWEQTILSGAEIEKCGTIKPSERLYDLGFGGYIRNSHKQRRIERYYDEVDLKTLLFGNLRGIKLQYTKVLPKVSFQSMVGYMSDCKASVIVGDYYYNDHFHTLRMYENLLAGCAILIDRQLDSRGDFYHGIPHGEMFYVDKPSDVKNFLHNDNLDELVINTRHYLLENRDINKLNCRLKTILEDICDLH